MEIKKKTGKSKKQQNRLSAQNPNIKKNVKILFTPNLEHFHKNENTIGINANNMLNYNNLRTIHKLQEELNNYKMKSQKLEEEIIQLNLKIKEISKEKKNIKNNKEEEEKNTGNNDNYWGQKINRLKKVVSSTYYVLIEIIELILNQKFKEKDKDNYNTLASKQIENISLDVYEQSICADEEKKSLIFEQIQQILFFKINFINKMYNLNLEQLCEKIKQWNFNTNKDKEGSFSSFSIKSNNNKKRNSNNTSINNSDLALGIFPPKSPKFPGGQESNSMISNLMEESTIKDFSTSIIHYNYNNAHSGGIGVDSFFFEGDNLLKYKEENENREISKNKDVNLINTSFKDLSIIKVRDEPGLENVSFTKNFDKYVSNIEEGDAVINTEDNKDNNKKIFIKNDNQLNISFNDI